jgi:hypothetical protein
MKRLEFPELATVSPFDCLLKVCNASSLGARLEDSFVTVHRIGELLASPDGDAAWLLAVDIFASFGGEDGGSRVPAIARGDKYGIDIFAREQLAQIAIEDTVLIAVGFIDQFLTRFTSRSLHIRDRDAADILHGKDSSEVVFASRSDPDDAQLDAIIG